MIEIHQKMVKIATSENNTFGIKWLKKKFEARYGDDISVVQPDETARKVCFKNMVDNLINAKWYQYKLGDTEDKAE